MAQPKIKRAWVTNQNLSFVAALTFSSPSLGPVVCERACRTSGFLEISSAVSAVAIYCKFAWRDPFDCREREDSGQCVFLRLFCHVERSRDIPNFFRKRMVRDPSTPLGMTERTVVKLRRIFRRNYMWFYAVLIQLRNTSATLQACAMQPPAKCGSRASNTSLMEPIPLSLRC